MQSLHPINKYVKLNHWITLFGLLGLLSACRDESLDEIKAEHLRFVQQNAAIQLELQDLRKKVRSEEQSNTQLKTEHEKLTKKQNQEPQNPKSADTEKQHEIVAKQTEIARLKQVNQRLQSQNRHPSWEELKDFLAKDNVGDKEYKRGIYDCKGFTDELRANARAQGFLSAAVYLSYPVSGHAITAFETTDRGLVYIEPQRDSVAYVQQGKPFGTIPIQSVKSEFFECPSDFLKPLKKTSFEETKLLTYAYFENFAARASCWQLSITKLFGADGNRFSYEDRKTWEANVKALGEELGLYDTVSGRYFQFKAPVDIVSSMQTYWF